MDHEFYATDLALQATRNKPSAQSRPNTTPSRQSVAPKATSRSETPHGRTASRTQPRKSQDTAGRRHAHGKRDDDPRPRRPSFGVRTRDITIFCGERERRALLHCSTRHHLSPAALASDLRNTFSGAARLSRIGLYHNRIDHRGIHKHGAWGRISRERHTVALLWGLPPGMPTSTGGRPRARTFFFQLTLIAGPRLGRLHALLGTCLHVRRSYDPQ